MRYVSPAPFVSAWVIGIAIVFLNVLPGLAQDGGQDMQEKSGIALVKPQAWSQNNQATVVEFLAVADRTVKGGVVAGYYVFRTAKTREYQVPAARVVKLIMFPEATEQLTRPDQRAALQRKIEETKEVSAKYPAAERILEKPLADLKADAEKYDAGNIKDAGVWKPKSSYYQKQADDAAKALYAEFDATKKVRSISIHSDTYFITLEEIVKADPTTKGRLDAVQGEYAKRCRKEEREDICEKLKKPGTTYEESSNFVKTLKSLRPEEDPAVARMVATWDRAVESAAKLTQSIETLQKRFEKEMEGANNPSQTIVVSAELISQINRVVEETAGVPEVIKIPLAEAKAMSTCAAGLAEIRLLAQAKSWFDVKCRVAELSAPAALIGPKSAAAVGLVERSAVAQIAKFETLKEEAKNLQGANKPKEALAKYREAWDVIPDKDVAAKIEELKK